MIKEIMIPLVVILGMSSTGTPLFARDAGMQGRCNASDQIESKNKGKGAEVASHRVGCADPSPPDIGGNGGTGSAPIGPEGGVVVSADGMAELAVPAGALSEIVEISVSAISPPGESMEFVTPAYDFQPDGLTFAHPAKLTLRYDPARLPSGVREGLMNVYVHHPDTGRWEGLYAFADTTQHAVFADVEHFTTFIGAPDRNILIYVVSDRTDSSAFGTTWYQDPTDFGNLKGKLADAGFNRSDAMDEVDLPILDAVTLSRYRQVWVMEGDGDGTIDVTAAERDLLVQFYSTGRGVWISGENNMDQPFIFYNSETNLYWHEDAGFLMEGFGVTNTGDMIFSYDVTYTYNHAALFSGVSWITFNGEIGRLESTNPAIQWAVTFFNQNSGPDAAVGTYNGLGVLDEKSIGAGRAVFDAGWVIGYSAFRLNKGDDNIQFCKNVANFLDN